MEREPLGAVSGWSDGNQCKVLVASIDSSAPITVRCNGQEIEVPMTPVGTDGVVPQVAWTGGATFTGLSPDSTYEWTARQGQQVVTRELQTGPSPGTYWYAFLATCDNPGTGLSSNRTVGPYADMKRWAERKGIPPRFIGLFDDLYYPDGTNLNDALGTGMEASTIGGNQARRALVDVCNLGMLYDETDPAIALANDPVKRWAMNKNNILTAWGDHEFKNDMGFAVDATTDPMYGDGKAVWDAFYGRLQPPLLNAANSYAYSAVYGDVTLIVTDGITNGNAWSTAASPVCYGDAQISDLLSAASAVNTPFMTWISPFVGHHFLDDSTGDGGKQSLAYFVPKEFRKLFTQQNTGLFDIMAAKKVPWSIFIGDWHQAMINENIVAAYSDPTDGQQVAEDVMVVQMGTINSSIRNDSGVAALTSGTSYPNGKCHRVVRGSDTADQLGINTCIRLEFFGNESPKRIRYTLMNAGIDVAFFEYLEGQSDNKPKPKKLRVAL